MRSGSSRFGSTVLASQWWRHRRHAGRPDQSAWHRGNAGRRIEHRRLYLGVLPGQSATFTEPLNSAVDLIGSSRITLDIASSTASATVFASVWDLGPDIETTTNGRTTTGPSSAVLPQHAVSPVRLTGPNPGEPRQATVALPSVSHQVPAKTACRS